MKPLHSQTIPLQKLLILHSDYVNELQKRTPETRGTYERTLREFMRWIRNEPEINFSVKDVERYKKFLLTKRKLSPVSVTMYLSSVRKFLDFLVKGGALTENSARQVKGGTQQTELTRRSISVQEVQRLVLAIERKDEIGFRDFAIVKLMVSCGLSEIELVRADIGDMKVKKDVIVLALQAKGMTSKELIVPLPKDAQEALKSYLGYRSRARETDPLFMSAGNRTRGRRMTSRGIRERINFYLNAAGIKNGAMRKITPLSLRNTAIKMMIDQGAEVDEIKKRFRIVKDSTVKLYQNMNQ